MNDAATFAAPEGVMLQAVSCPSTTFCVAGGGSDYVFVSNDPTGGSAAWTRTQVIHGEVMLGLSCPSSGFCVGVDGGDGIHYDVGSLLPVTFAAYARVLHPASRAAADGASADVTWSAVAAANGRIAHAAMEWIAITGDWKFEQDAAQPGCGTNRHPRGHCLHAPP